ncbi:MAG TPA: serine--tRNA ligase [Patescibacteria group bacterium]
MLDIKFIRDNPELVQKKVEQKGYKGSIAQLIKVDGKRRDLIEKIDKLRSKRKEVADKRDLSEGKKIKEDLKQKEIQLEEVNLEYGKSLNELPNLPLDGVPVGDESQFEIIKTVGKIPKIDLPKDHLELGEILDVIDVERAAKVSGSRFGYLKNEAAILEFALVEYALATLTKEGFSPIIPPVLIKENITQQLGYWQGKGQGEYYRADDEDESGLYLIGTSEHSIVPMHKDEILENLPKRYVGFSSAFRREAGSYGKDTRGILRVHQFDKVEMIAFVKPEDDEKERKKMLELSEKLVASLGLPYQVKKLASGDISFPAAETIDIEIWIPSQNTYRETHSISTTTDFQARRLNIKFNLGVKKEFVHILNGTAFAIGRTIIAILENYQKKDGSVEIPKVLQKYTGFAKIKPKSTR